MERRDVWLFRGERHVLFRRYCWYTTNMAYWGKRISGWPLTRGQYDKHAGEGRLDDDASYLPSNSGGIPEVGEREHIRRALANMPRDYAIVLVLSAAQGVPYQEIAAIVGISPNAAATRISRAKRMFAEVYQRMNDADPGEQE